MDYVLMRENREVLEFDVDLSSGTVLDARPLEDAPWAPPGVLDHWGKPWFGLSRFIRDRCISFARADLPDILQATGARNPIELAFRSGGFSLSDPYWYRARNTSLTWESGNYFDNDWDGTFDDAVLKRDYDALRAASAATPSVTCAGSARKAWLRDAQGPLLVKAPVHDGSMSVLGEVLASRMLARLLPEDEYVRYELVERDGETYSACRPIVGPGEELAPAWQALSEAESALQQDEPAADLLGNELLDEFASTLERLGVAGGGQLISKMTVFSHLTFNRDMHPHNLGIIRTGPNAFRLAPFFDFDRTFGLSEPSRVKWVSKNPKTTMLLVAFSFSNLDPSWDYSWYDPRTLDGFEREIEQTLSSAEDGAKGFAEIAASLFTKQREYVNHIAGLPRP